MSINIKPFSDNDEKYLTFKAEELKTKLHALRSHSVDSIHTHFKFRISKRCAFLRKFTGVAIFHIFEKLFRYDSNEQRLNKLILQYEAKRRDESTPLHLQKEFELKSLEKESDTSEQKKLVDLSSPIELKKTDDLQESLAQIEKILNEMEQTHQETMLEEDAFAARSEEEMVVYNKSVQNLLNQLKVCKEKVEGDLHQCLQLAEKMRNELKLVLRKKNTLKSNAKNLKKKYVQTLKSLEESLTFKRIQLNLALKKIAERREQDFVVINAFRTRRMELLQKLMFEEREIHKQHFQNHSVKNHQSGVLSFTSDKNAYQGEKQDFLKGQSKSNQSSELEIDQIDTLEQVCLNDWEASDCSFCLESSEIAECSLSSLRALDEFTPQFDAKVHCIRKSHDENRICLVDQLKRILSNVGAKPLNNLQLLEEAEGIQILDESMNPITFYSLKNILSVGKKLGNFSTECNARSIMYSTMNMALRVHVLSLSKKNCETFSRESSHIIRFLINEPCVHLLRQIELFELQSDDDSNNITKNNEKNISTFSWFVHIEQRTALSLECLIEQQSKLNIQDVRTLGESIAAALLYLHDRGIAHTSLEPNLVFITQRQLVKVGGLHKTRVAHCINSNQEKMSQVLNDLDELTFAAPEVRIKGKYIDWKKADVYSFGLILLYAILGTQKFFISKRNPIENTQMQTHQVEQLKDEKQNIVNKQQLKQNQLVINQLDKFIYSKSNQLKERHSNVEYMNDEQIGEFLCSFEIANELRALIESCLRTVPLDRISILDARTHCFFANE